MPGVPVAGGWWLCAMVAGVALCAGGCWICVLVAVLVAGGCVYAGSWWLVASDCVYWLVVGC